MLQQSKISVDSSVGLTFEKKILANEANNVKFNFLRSTDPYHAYYRFKVSSCLTYIALYHSKDIAGLCFVWKMTVYGMHSHERRNYHAACLFMGIGAQASASVFPFLHCGSAAFAAVN